MKKVYSWLLACFALVTYTTAANVLTVGNISVPQGGQATLEVSCMFETQYTAFELELSLPEGLTLVVDEEDGKPIVTKGFVGDHALSGSRLSSGNYKFTCYSMSHSSLPTNGVLMRVTVEADRSLSIDENLTGNLVAAEFTRTADSEGEMLSDASFTLTITTGTNAMTGDVNNDNCVSIADLTTLVNIIQGEGNAPFDSGQADVNGDSHINYADVRALVNILLGKE